MLFSMPQRRYAPLALLAPLLAGCGGSTDFGNFNRSLNGDLGTGYNSNLSSRQTGASGRAANADRGVYPRIETSFQLASVPGDPFDYEKVSVQVNLHRPDGSTVDVPAFFDGGTTWRMRYTPNAPGTYSVVSVKLNREIAHEDKLDKKEWNVTGDPLPGFIRVDRGDKARFIFDNGARYFPIGHNVAWQSAQLPDYAGIFGKMAAQGENWSRIWMTHWDGKNLDWSLPKAKATTEKKVDSETKTVSAETGKGEPAGTSGAAPVTKVGDIDLEAAKKWDVIVDAAGKNGIYFQMVLQHHGQYSSKSGYKYSGNVDPNWEDNPYNVKNGGFLNAPEEFFSNPQARALTRRKLYYILSRWGWSPNILSFELFNEVEGTDAAKGKMWDGIALWHKEMSLFLRQFDGYHHLLTSSSARSVALDSPIWETVDYVQYHAYPPDVVTSLGAPLSPDARKLNKPIFYGEFGPQGVKDPDGSALHRGLWASLTSDASGVAQYWDWENVDKLDLYHHFGAATKFVRDSGLADHGGLTTAALTVETTQRADLRFAPGGGWQDDAPKQTEFVVGENGPPPGIAQFPSYLQGDAHRKASSTPLTLQVRMPQAGAFQITVGQVSKAGANLKIAVDGKAVEKEFAATDIDSTPSGEKARLSVPVAEGVHTITVENTGKDWVVLRELALSNYASALAGQARLSKDFAAIWLYRRATSGESGSPSPISGKVDLPGLQKGRYRATWWDTVAGKSLETAQFEIKDSKGASLNTPPVTRDIACYITKAGVPETKSRGKQAPKGKQARNSQPTYPEPTVTPSANMGATTSAAPTAPISTTPTSPSANTGTATPSPPAANSGTTAPVPTINPGSSTPPASTPEAKP